MSIVLGEKSLLIFSQIADNFFSLWIISQNLRTPGPWSKKRAFQLLDFYPSVSTLFFNCCISDFFSVGNCFFLCLEVSVEVSSHSIAPILFVVYSIFHVISSLSLQLYYSTLLVDVNTFLKLFFIFLHFYFTHFWLFVKGKVCENFHKWRTVPRACHFYYIIFWMFCQQQNLWIFSQVLDEPHRLS